MAAAQRRVRTVTSHITANDTRPKVCLIMGAGAGIGATVAARFATGGFTAVLCRRSDQAGLDSAVEVSYLMSKPISSDTPPLTTLSRRKLRHEGDAPSEC